VRAAAYIEQAIPICDESWPAAAGAFRADLAILRARDGGIEAARALLVRGDAQLRGVRASDHGELLCKRGQVEHGAGDVTAAKAALAEAEAIVDEMGVGAESELGKLVAELKALLG
jgi:hypothetical protein